MKSILEINGKDITADEIQKDVIAALKNGYKNKFAFCPETVQSLLDKIEELEHEIEWLMDEIEW